MNKTVSDVMGTVLFTVTTDTGVASAARFAAEDQVRHLLVLEDGSLVGIVTQGQLCQGPGHKFVKDVMRAPVLCIEPDTTVEEASDIMLENDISYLPIVAGGFMLGYVDKSMVTGHARVNTQIGERAARRRSGD
jgi:acetoin utilization protein AcuB